VMAESSSVAECERDLREAAEARAASQAERIAELEESRARQDTAGQQRLAELARKVKVLQGTLVQKESIIEVMESKLEKAAVAAAKPAPPASRASEHPPAIADVHSRLDKLEEARGAALPESPALAEKLDRIQAGLDSMAQSKTPAPAEEEAASRGTWRDLLPYFLAGMALCLAIGFGLLWLGERRSASENKSAGPTRVWAPDAIHPAKPASPEASP